MEKKLSKYVIGLKCVNGDLTSLHTSTFRWKRRGVVEAPDWNPNPVCGGGLHFLQMGQNDPGLWENEDDKIWLVVRALRSETVEIGGKSKAKNVTVIFSGSPAMTSGWLKQNHPGEWFGTLLSGGDGSKNTGGDGSTNTGGDASKNAGGDASTNTGGYGSTNTGGYGSTNTGGQFSTNTGGTRSTNTGGDGSTLIWKINESEIKAIVGKDGIKPNVSYVCIDGKVVKK